MSYINLNRTIDAGLDTSRIGLSGEYRMVVRKAVDNSIVRELKFDNLITDAGLNRLGTASAISYFFVGTGTNTPATSDTQMGAYVGYHSLSGASAPADPAPTSPGYISQSSTAARFSPGEATGNLTEVGIGWFDGALNSTNHRIFSRALIVDSLGTPTTLTVLADEYLDVFYTLKAYSSLSDESGSVVISGTTYNYTARIANAGATRLNSLNQPANAAYVATAYSGTLGAITGTPSGSSASLATSAVQAPYVNNSLTIAGETSVPLNTGNLVGGINSLLTASSSSSLFNARTQIEFDTPIPKDNTKILKLTLAYSWGRH